VGIKSLFLAAGHGGADRGNTAAGMVERDELIALAGGMRRWSRLRQQPQGLGGLIFLDDGLDLLGQLRALARWRPSAVDGDLAIDLHLDYNARRPRGGALAIHNGVGQAATHAATMLGRWCAATGIVSNGMHLGRQVAPIWRGWDDFGWTRPRGWPAVILECGSLNSAADMAIVRDPQAQALLLTLIVESWSAEG
jgi:N-acetylmuramoyl-L-alanine amidase